MEKITKTEKDLVETILLRIEWSEVSMTSALGCLEVAASSLKVRELLSLIKEKENEQSVHR